MRSLLGVSVFVIGCGVGNSQTVPVSFLDLLKAQLQSSSLHSSLQVSGTADWVAGSTHEFGPATLTARLDGSAEMPLAPSGAMQADTLRSFTRIRGTQDRDIPTPPDSVPSGQMDTSAVQVLAAAEAAGGSGWTGMKGTGVLNGLGLPNSTQANATLEIKDGHTCRLVMQTGQVSYVLHIAGVHGQYTNWKGATAFIPPTTAWAGLIALPRILGPYIESARRTVIDQGTTTIDALTYRRVTFAEEMTGETPDTHTGSIILTDLYFDPSSRLLAKSVGWVRVSSRDTAEYLEVTTYSDYRKVDGSSVPFRIEKTLNGTSEWTLQLQDAHLNVALNDADFSF